MKAITNQSLYLSMIDGNKLAIDVWLPKDLKENQKVPTVICATRYHREEELGLIPRILSFFGKKTTSQKRAALFTDKGYAHVRVDVRGTGASFGTQTVIWSDQEIVDLDEVMNWIVAQPWSNGKVASTGGSYVGNTAELISMNNNQALKIVAPLYNDFNPNELGRPGGILNRWFIKTWHAANHYLDNNNIEGLALELGKPPIIAKLLKLFSKGVKPVDGDRTKTMLAKAIKQHANNIDVLKACETTECYDDIFGTSGLPANYTAPYTRRQKIEASNVPMHVEVGWMDAETVNGAISRFNSFSNIQEIFIGPWSHGGVCFVDPFLKTKPQHVGLYKENIPNMLTNSMDRYCKENVNPVTESSIKYYVMGLGQWKKTKTYPIPGTEYKKLYFSSEHRLGAVPCEEEKGQDQYQVDFTTSTGTSTRWHTQATGKLVNYPDRRYEDKKLLCYTSEAFANDTEITGNIIVNLFVKSSHEDCAFHVYFEDVAPDGTVTYITEGLLRSVHRKVSEEKRKYYTVGPYHSFEREDMRPMVPGQVEEINIEMYATSVLIKKDHCIRIAIAGFDGSVFERYPKQGTPVWEVQRNSKYSSNVEIPFIK